MKIEIKVTRGNSTRKKQTENTKEDTKSETKEKRSPITNYIKQMSLTKKVVYGTVATILATRAVDNLTEQKEIVVTPAQYENTSGSVNKTIKSVEDQIKIMNEPIKVEAKEVIKNYTNADTYEEEKTVDALYRNQYLEVTGKVKEIIDEDTIELSNEDYSKWYSEWVSVECNFNNQKDLEQIQNLKVGSEIELIGYCTGYEEMTVELDNCIFKP